MNDGKLTSQTKTLELREVGAQAAGCFLKILAIETSEVLSDSIKDKYRSTIEGIDRTIELRFYKL